MKSAVKNIFDSFIISHVSHVASHAILKVETHKMLSIMYVTA